jgi:hypothetical protein
MSSDNINAQSAGLLEDWADEANGILLRFTRDQGDLHVGQGDQARFTGMVLEARDLLSELLGPANSFGWQLERTRIEGISNFIGSQSYHSIEEAEGILRSAASAVRRKQSTHAAANLATARTPYIASTRLDELRGINSGTWDLRRLIVMCEEINEVWAKDCVLATAMLVRAITDHVPPIFGQTNFIAYASSVATTSQRASMNHLSRSLRDIANGALHIQIRQKEVVPALTQVDFRQDLDVLLGEVVRELRN